MMISKLGVVFIYSTSLPRIMVLFYRRREGVFTALAYEEMLRYVNEIKSAFCNVCSMVISVVIMGACTQAADTVFLF